MSLAQRRHERDTQGKSEHPEVERNPILANRATRWLRAARGTNKANLVRRVGDGDSSSRFASKK